MLLKKYEGTKSGIKTFKVTQERLSAFARAVGVSSDAAPALSHEVPAHALDTRWLPTFLTLFREGDFELLTLMGVELRSVLHGEQEYEYDGYLKAGDEVSYQSIVAHITEKESKKGALHFIILETDFHLVGKESEAHHKVGTARSTIVYRRAAS
ncbi:MAG: MaoC family dehydratase N-terminal domain-containing protein [Methylotenera sp.]|nr:MaoC family dehydratase N-terminal domain-containing protein [Oligoflexia bacterium]